MRLDKNLNFMIPSGITATKNLRKLWNEAQKFFSLRKVLIFYSDSAPHTHKSLVFKKFSKASQFSQTQTPKNEYLSCFQTSGFSVLARLKTGRWMRDFTSLIFFFVIYWKTRKSSYRGESVSISGLLLLRLLL